jgi:hypothetical protein
MEGGLLLFTPYNKEKRMKHLELVVSEQQPVPVITLAAPSVKSAAEVGQRAKPIAEILVYSPGPVPCRCGRYLSEDFDGRLFCRGCEGPDPADITARLPFCHRRQ